MKQFFELAHQLLNNLYPTQEIDALAKQLLQKVCGISRTDILMYKNKDLLLEKREELEQMLHRLQLGEPIQYIFGETEFFGMTFKVAPGVLIPRPETEELVDLILHENQAPGLSLLDIGTGSGCIAISLAKRLPLAKAEAWDVSTNALSIAEENSRINSSDVYFRLIDVLKETPNEHSSRFDIIVSNPPYVCEEEAETMHCNVLQYEPHLALFVPNNDPLRFYRRIAELGISLLRNEGKLYFEINERFGSQTAEMLENLGYSQIEIVKDIFGKERIVKACRLNKINSK